MTRRWDPRLMSAQTALDLAGGWPLAWHYGRSGLEVLCAHDTYAGDHICGRRVVLAPATVEELLEAVLRHMAQAHNVDMGGPGRERPDRNSEGDARLGDAAGRRRGGGAGDRPAHQTAAARLRLPAAGDDRRRQPPLRRIGRILGRAR